MKTQQQKRFERLVSTLILSEPYITSRNDLLEDFKTDRELYYDIFCDKIFDFTELRKDTLLIDDRGLTYLSHEPRSKSHVYLNLLSPGDIQENIDDIIFYIDLALDTLEKRLVDIKTTFK